ncbi:probable transporter Mch4p [Trichomonascus vanleenenianus]|uniref:putative transporter Mch4p n=1 Tax=Trichomonascus vanleenenianus TaxID=2268995 RepID=UPI003ECB6435
MEEDNIYITGKRESEIIVDVEKQGSENPAAFNGVNIETSSTDNVSSPSSSADDVVPKQPPDGGWIAWIQVAAAFFAFFNSWGIVNTFGTFQSYYKAELLSNEPPSTISWIGSIQGFFVVSGTILTGRLLDAGRLRLVICASTFFLTFGMMMASLSTEFYQLFLSQGVCLGLGCSGAFLGSVATVAPYFNRKRAFAIGIVASGSSVGAIIYPIMVERLIPRIGFPWTARILGFMIFGMMLFPCIAFRPLLPPRKAGPFIDIESFTDWPYVLFTLGTFVGFMGLYIPIFYIETFARSIGFDERLLPYIVPILSTGSVAGRILPNFIADKIGPLNTLIPCSAAAAILAFSWIRVQSTAGLIVFALFYGFFSGTYVSLPPATLSALSPDMSKIGTRLGMAFFVIGFGVLIGSPVAGAINTRQHGEYLGVQIFSGVSIIVALMFLLLARLFISRELMVKA